MSKRKQISAIFEKLTKRFIGFKFKPMFIWVIYLVYLYISPRILSLQMKSQITLNLKCHMSRNIKYHYIMSNIMKCQMPWNVKCHEMTNVMKCQRVMKCQMSSNVNCHKMSNVMKCWCWIYDPKQKHQALHTAERTIVPRTVIVGSFKHAHFHWTAG